MLIVTAIAASILGMLYIKLSSSVIVFRRQYKVNIGNGEEEELLRAVRAQANLAEYSPITLILLACAELNGGPWWLTTILALVFIVGRIIHSIGMKQTDLPWQPRVRGMQLTFLTIAALCITNLLLVLGAILFS